MNIPGTPDGDALGDDGVVAALLDAGDAPDEPVLPQDVVAMTAVSVSAAMARAWLFNDRFVDITMRETPANGIG